MENRTGIPNLAQMGMTMDFEFVLSINTTLHDLNEGINLVLGKGGLKRDLCKFELSTSLEWFPWPFYGCSLGNLIFAPAKLILFK
jgi:hypothetical protein